MTIARFTGTPAPDEGIVHVVFQVSPAGTRKTIFGYFIARNGYIPD